MSEGHRPRLLVLGAGLYQLAGIRRAAELGCEVITVDNVPSNPGHQLSSSSLNVSTTDVEGVVEAARALDVDGVVTFASDTATQAVVACARELDLPGADSSAIHRMSNKGAFRRLQTNINLPCPEFVVTSDVADVQDFGARADGSFVVKPTDSSGSKGVALVDSSDRQELASAVAAALQSSRSGEVIAEAFIPGTEVGGDAVMSDGALVSCFPTVKHKSGFVVTGHSYPPEIPLSVVNEVRRQIGAACVALDYRNGVLNFDVMVDGDRVTIVEMSPRTGGNGIPELIERSYGYPMLTAAVAFSLGRVPEAPSSGRHVAAGSLVIGSPHSGIIRSISSAARIREQVDGVFTAEVLVSPGDHVERFTYGGASFGYALFDIDDVYGHATSAIASALNLEVE